METTADAPTEDDPSFHFEFELFVYVKVGGRDFSPAITLAQKKPAAPMLEAST
jgi:hypothetical protein